MQVITIPNFLTYQHYHTERGNKPIWIKLYLDILQNEKVQKLKDNERWIYVSLLLLAARHHNEIPADFDYIARNCSQKKRGIGETILRLKDLKLIDIKRIAKCYQSAIPEESRVEKIRKEKSRVDVTTNDSLLNKSKPNLKEKIASDKESAEIQQEIFKEQRK